MEAKESRGKEEGKNNPIKNFCWPLSGKEQEDCIRNYEGLFSEEGGEKGREEITPPFPE